MAANTKLISEAPSEEIARLNQIADKWASDTVSSLKSGAAQFRKGRGDLVRSLKKRLRTDFGVVERIAFSLARQGIFVEKGVGRGFPISRQGAGGGIGGGRLPKPWFNPVFIKGLPELADKVAETFADMYLSEMERILIK